MLSDEEREAVDYWKKHMKILHWNTQLASEHYIKVLLDLVEKQSKEIEELKKPKYIINCETNEITKLTNDFVSKDKIKAKIEELENGNKNTFIRGEKILVLQSLLEKE